MASENTLRELEEKYEDYKVYDNQGEKIGKVDDLFVDETDREEYIGVKLGFLGMKSTLIPMDIVRVNEAEKSIEVAETRDRVKGAPSFDDDEDITPEYEERIRSHFGLGSTGGSTAGYGGHAETEPDDVRASGEPSTYDAGDDTQEYEDHPAAVSEDREGRTTSGGSSGDVPAFGQSGGQSGTEDRSVAGEPTEGSSSPESGSFADSSADRAPTTRQTEETETFQEGGRTKIRRRVIREEIYEEDDPRAKE